MKNIECFFEAKSDKVGTPITSISIGVFDTPQAFSLISPFTGFDYRLVDNSPVVRYYLSGDSDTHSDLENRGELEDYLEDLNFNALQSFGIEDLMTDILTILTKYTTEDNELYFVGEDLHLQNVKGRFIFSVGEMESSVSESENL